MTELRKQILKNVKRIVIKVGTSVLTDEHGRLGSGKIAMIAKQVYDFKNKGIDVILVSSGAIGGGMIVLGLDKRPARLSQQQAMAAVGQAHLIEEYNKYFKSLSGGAMTAAQILLTQDDFSNRQRYVNAKNTLYNLLSYKKLVPIINENDTVATDEIKFGDNDKLSSLVCNMVEAELLIILSDVDGLFRDAKEVVSIVEKITLDIERLAKPTTKQVSVGGMVTKLEAAKAITKSGSVCVIANGHDPDIINKILRGEDVGTLFLPSAKKMKSKKSWIAFGLKAKGRVIVDTGAHKAIVFGGKSLLASGITGVVGNFQGGNVAGIAMEKGKDFAKGIVNYSSEQIKKIKGLKTLQIEAALGCKTYDEVVHRDNMVLL